MKKFLALSQAVAVALSSVAMADNDVIFDAKVGGGVYSTDSAAKKGTSGLIDVSGVLVIGDANRSNIKVDMGLLSTVRDGGVEVVEADIAAKGRYLEDGKFGFEVAGLPFKYRKDDRYYELSVIEVSAIVKLAEGNGHQLIAKAGINPFTKRTYKNPYDSFTTYYDPVEVSDGFFYNPSYAEVYGAPAHVHDPAVNGTWNDNREVYYGGGTMTSSVNTSFDSSERSIRFPVAVEYKYDDGKKLTINAMAYYTLRMGRDSLQQVDNWRDQYDGYVSYSNVHWQTCYDYDSEGRVVDSYYCNPYNIQYQGQGRVVERSSYVTELAGKGFTAHTVGGKAEANYKVFENEYMKLLLNGTVRAELDTHVMDGTVGAVRTSKRLGATAGAIVRF